MANLTEQLQEDTKRKLKDAAKTGKSAAKILSKGIALIFNGTVLSEASIMKALDKKVEKTGDLSFSYANVSMEELQKHGKIEEIEEPVLKEAMKYFDKYCREYGVKYSALKTKVEGENQKEEDGFIIFFEGKNDKVIEHIIKSAAADWARDQKNRKEAGKETGKDAGKDTGKDTGKERPSVLAKLAFFRNRVKESVDQNKENEHSSEKARQHDQER